MRGPGTGDQPAPAVRLVPRSERRANTAVSPALRRWSGRCVRGSRPVSRIPLPPACWPRPIPPEAASPAMTGLAASRCSSVLPGLLRNTAGTDPLALLSSLRPLPRPSPLLCLLRSSEALLPGVLRTSPAALAWSSGTRTPRPCRLVGPVHPLVPGLLLPLVRPPGTNAVPDLLGTAGRARTRRAGRRRARTRRAYRRTPVRVSSNRACALLVARYIKTLALIRRRESPVVHAPRHPRASRPGPRARPLKHPAGPASCSRVRSLTSRPGLPRPLRASTRPGRTSKGTRPTPRLPFPHHAPAPPLFPSPFVHAQRNRATQGPQGGAPHCTNDLVAPGWCGRSLTGRRVKGERGAPPQQTCTVRSHPRFLEPGVPAGGSVLAVATAGPQPPATRPAIRPPGRVPHPTTQLSRRLPRTAGAGLKT